MPDRPTADDLTRWQGLCEAATPGPWDGVISTGCVRYLGCPIDEIDLQHGDYIASVTSSATEGSDVCRDVRNAEFIAESRTAMPRLIAEVRRLNELLAENGISDGPAKEVDQ